MEKLAERITDADFGVRAALKGLLSGTVLPLLEASSLAPFLPLLLAHVASAMTHLSEDIRQGPPQRRQNSPLPALLSLFEV